MVRADGMSKHDDGEYDGEELSGGGDGGARQRTEVADRVEDKILAARGRYGVDQDVGLPAKRERKKGRRTIASAAHC